MKRNSLSYSIILLTVFTVLVSCAPEKFSDAPEPAAEKINVSANVIYGTDGRLDLYQLTDDRLRAMADSTVALVKNSNLSTAGNTTSVTGQNFGSGMNLCSDEKFREQDMAAFCSGTLVGPDVVLTAGHCIETIGDCQTTSLVFGFAVKSVGVLPKSVSSLEVYRCVEVVKTLRVNTGADFAIIRLDRKVDGHQPRAIRTEGEVESTASLVVIGHPVGLPTKVTTGGTVRSIATSGYFVANLDTYGGNSGSGVFNLSTGLIEGVLVRGEQDFVSRGSCTTSKVCAEGTCRGEDVTRISSVRPFLSIAGPGPIDPNPSLSEKFSSNVKLAIPDNNKTGIVSVLQVSSTPKGRKVFVNVNITHTYIGDLNVILTAADGKAVTLHAQAGGSSDNIVKSYEITSSLGGTTVSGIYKLSVQDLAARDTGNLESWSVEFK